MERTTKLIEVFKNYNFTKLWIGQIVSALGDRFHQVALLGLIIRNGGNVGEELSRITFWSTLPFFLFSLFSGVLSDRLSRRKIMIGSDISRALLVCAIPWLISDSAYIAPAYPVIFIIGVFTCFFSPAKYSIIPDVVEDRHLLAANALIASSALLSILAGTAIGSIVFDKIGFKPSLYFDAFTYLFSAGTIFLLTVREKEYRKIRSFFEILSDIRDGMKHIYQDERLKILIIFNAIFWFIGVSFYIAISDFADKVLNLKFLTPLGFVFTLLGAGLFTGSILVGKYGNKVKRNTIYTWSIASLSFGIILFSLVKSYTLIMVITYFTGIAGGAFLAPINADIQMASPSELRGRIFACRDIFVNASVVAPTLVIGKLTALIPVRNLMLYLGIGVCVFSLFVMWSSIKLNNVKKFV